MNSTVKKYLLDVIADLNGTVDHGKQRASLGEDEALIILESFRDNIREELKEEIAAL